MAMPIRETTQAPPAETTQAPPAETTQAPPAETTQAPPAKTTQAPPAETTQAPPAETTQAPPAETTQGTTTENPRGEIPTGVYRRRRRRSDAAATVAKDSVEEDDECRDGRPSEDYVCPDDIVINPGSGDNPDSEDIGIALKDKNGNSEQRNDVKKRLSITSASVSSNSCIVYKEIYTETKFSWFYFRRKLVRRLEMTISGILHNRHR